MTKFRTIWTTEDNYVEVIDQRKLPHEFLLSNLKGILEMNDIDLLLTPRKNLVEGLTQDQIQKWGWNVNEQGWVNWPDVQKRIYKNTPNIQWTGHQIHGMVSGYSKYAIAPIQEQFCIIHNKKSQRQEEQNTRYEKIEKGEI